jgi:hypothetical protein
MLKSKNNALESDVIKVIFEILAKKLAVRLLTWPYRAIVD